MDSSYSGRFRLTTVDVDGRERVIPVRLGAVSLGRDPDNTVQLDKKNVSRHHARITRESRVVFAEDLGSSGGVYVNGQRITEKTALAGGDVVKIGDYLVSLEGKFRAPGEITDQTNIAIEQTVIVRREDLPNGTPEERTMLVRRENVVFEAPKRQDTVEVESTRLPASLKGLVAILVLSILVLAGLLLWRELAHQLEPPPPPPPATVKGDIADQLGNEAHVALTNLRYDEAFRKASSCLQLEPHHPMCKSIASAAYVRLEAEEVQREVLENIRAGDWRRAWESLSRIPPGQRPADLQGLATEVAKGLNTQLLGDVRRARDDGALEVATGVLDELDAYGLGDERAAAEREAIRSAQDDASRATKRRRATRVEPAASEQPPVRAVYLQGVAALRSGEDEAAVTFFERCIARDADHALSHKAAGIALVRLGQFDRAAEMYERYIELEPNGKDADQIREQLERYRQRSR